MNRRVIFEIADLLTSNESIVTSVREVLKVQEMANIVARSGRATTRLSLVCDIKAKYFSCYGNYEVDGQNTFC